MSVARFMVQKPCQTIARVIKLPVGMPGEPRQTPHQMLVKPRIVSVNCEQTSQGRDAALLQKM